MLITKLMRGLRLFLTRLELFLKRLMQRLMQRLGLRLVLGLRLRVLI